ncbi:MAG: sigma-54 dependent transcriptional regulator [Thermodesulfobacteriota bacterium]
MEAVRVILLDNGQDPGPDLAITLGAAGIPAVRLEDPVQAAEILREGGFGALVVNLRACPEWPELFEQLRVLELAVPALAVADKGTVAEAVTVLRRGGTDYLERPVSPERLSAALSAVQASQATRPCPRPQADSDLEQGFANILGTSEAIRKVFALIRKVSDSDTTVLVEGESGTGKELIARALHSEGGRRTGPFVPVNCGAIPSELLESELFGHEKGAFTHAIRTRIGRFELADSGTIFLDEIAEMSPLLQVKILRVLQDRRFERIGGTRTIRSDFRVIAATNRNLEAEVRAGRFREDLYYRLNVIPIPVPPLRERLSDLPLLVNAFIERFNRTKRKTIDGVDGEVMGHLLRYPWPGNVRELENVVERMVILAADDRLTVQDLPERILLAGDSRARTIDAIPAEGFSLNDEVASFERRLIIQALNQSGWVKNRAAKLLTINRTTLLEKIKKHNLSGKRVAGG